MTLDGPSLPPKAGGRPKQIVVLLHGLGDSGHGLIPIGEQWAPHLPDALFVTPHAPHICDFVPSGRQWFNLTDWSPLSVLNGVKSAAPILNQFIDTLLGSTGLPSHALALMGFSQGCMMTLYVGPRRAEKLAGLLGYAGALVGSESLAFETRSHPPVLLAHGHLDDVVPYGAMPAAAMALQMCGFSVETVSRPMLGHSIDDVCLDAGLAFLKRCLPGES